MRPDGNTARAAAVPVVVVLLVAVLVGMLLPRPAAAQEGGETDTTVAPTADATTPTTSTETPTTGETPTTLADLDTPEGPVREAPLTESEKASRTIDWVVGGLLLLALVVAVATVVFWRRTRPARLVAEEMAETAQQRGLGLSPAAGPEASWSQPQAQPEAPQPGGPRELAPRPPTGAAAVQQPPKPLPTAPGSWGAFAAEVGLEASEDSTGPSPEQPSDAQQPRVAQEAVEARQAMQARGGLQPPETPRPAFETASTGSWASQGWGEQGGDEPPVLPQGFAGSGSPQGSWRWNERAGQRQGAAGPVAPGADAAEGEVGQSDAADGDVDQSDGDSGGGVSGPL